MDGAVDAPVDQRLLDLLGEEPLAADLQEAAVLHLVAGGCDHHQWGGRLDGGGVLQVGAERGGDAALHEAGLGEAQLRAARADADWLRGHRGKATSGRLQTRDRYRSGRPPATG